MSQLFILYININKPFFERSHFVGRRSRGGLSREILLNLHSLDRYIVYVEIRYYIWKYVKLIFFKDIISQFMQHIYIYYLEISKFYSNQTQHEWLLYCPSQSFCFVIIIFESPRRPPSLYVLWYRTILEKYF